MKPSFLLSSKAGSVFMIVCLSAILLVTSCGKKYDPVPEPVGDLSMMAVNAVSGGVSQDLLLNGAVKVPALTYGSFSPYFIMSNTTSTIGFYDTGTTTKMNAGGSIALPIGAKVSLYYFNVGEGKVNATIYDDTTPNPATGKAKVRFIHLNSYLITGETSSTPISITATGSSSSLVSSLTFAKSSLYTEVDPGTTFNFTIAGGVAGAPFNGPIAADKIYTIWIDGTSATNLTGHLVVQN